MVELKARCFCGSVRISCDGVVKQVGHCHCESCRRATSSPITTFFTLDRADVCFEGESPCRFESSPGVWRSFCPRCGSHMAFEGYKRPDDIDLYVASLEDGYSLDIEEHWHWEERVSWLHVEDSLPKLEG